MSRVLRWSALLAGALVAGLLALALALRSEPAQDVLSQWIGRLASRRGLVIRVHELRGNPPWSFSIDELTIDDRDGRWLTARKIQADADPVELIGRRIALRTLTADSLDVARLPELGPPTDDEPPPRFTVDVGELQVRELRLGAHLLGRTDAPLNGLREWALGDDWTRAIEAHGSGSYLIREEILRGSFVFDAPDTAGMLPSDLGVRTGALHATAVLNGHIVRPQGEIVLSLDGVSRASAAADAVKLRLRGWPANGLGSDEDRDYHFELDSTWTNPVLASALDGLLGSTVDLSAAGSIAPHATRIEIPSVALEGAALSMKTVARVEDRRRLVVQSASVKLADVAKLGHAVHEHVLSGELAVTAGLTADLERRSFAADVSAQASDLRMSEPGLDALLGGAPSAAAHVESDGVDGPLRVRNLHLDAAKARLTAGGAVGRTEIDGEAALEIDDVADLSTMAGASLAGALRAEATARGPIGSPAVHAVLVPRDLSIAHGTPLHGTVTVDAANLRELPSGSVHAALQSSFGAVDASSDFTLQPHRALSLANIAVRAKGAEITGASTLDLESKLVAGDLSGTFSDLQALSPFVAGRIQGSGTVRVSLAEADEQSATVAARLSDVRYDRGTRVQIAALQADARLNGLKSQPGGSIDASAKRITVGELLVAELDLGADGTGGSFDVHADAKGRYKQRFSVRSTAALDLRGDGLSARVSALDGELGGRRLRLERELLIARAGQGMSVEQLDLALADARVSGSFRKTQGKLDGAVEVRALPLDLAELISPGLDLTGTLSANATVSGTEDRPEVRFAASSGNVSVGSIVNGELPPVAVRTEGRWSWQGLVADASLEGGEANHFSVHAEVPPENGSVAIDLKGSADANLLNGLGLVGEDRVSGVLEADLRLVGSTSAPDVIGDVRWRSGSYENAAIGAVLRDVQAHLIGEGSRLRIDQFDATDGDTGRAHAAGSIDFSSGFADVGYVVDVSLVGMKVARLDELSAQAGGDLHVEGKGSAPVVTGSVDVERAEISVPERASAGIVVFDKVVEKNVEAARPDRYVPAEASSAVPVRFDLKIRAPGRVFVRDSDVDTEWQGQLAVSGTSANPRLQGRLKLVRGSFQLLNVRLKATDGTITFDGAETIDPVLDITGEAKKNDIDATVNVSGRSSDLKVKFTSDPPLPEDEVLAKLLFGKNPSQLSPVQSVQLAAAVARLSGKGGGVGLDPLGWVRRTLGFDTVDVTTAENSTGTSQLSVGKYVAENVFVRLNKGLTDTTSSAAVDVEITRNLSIESQLGSDQTGSLGLTWKWNY